MKKLTLRVDFENAGESFWSSARVMGQCLPRELWPLAQRGFSATIITASTKRVAQLVKYIEGMEGWNDPAPDFAKHPLIISID